MSFIFGAGALFVAFLIIVVFRRLTSRLGARWNPEAYGASEVISLSFTGLSAFGTVAIASGVANGHFPAALIELGVALGALVGACFVTWLLLGRGLTAAAAAPASPAGTAPVRPGGTPPAPKPKSPAGSQRRAA